MNIARITHISPPGKVWTYQGTPLYPFSVSFDDLQTGEVNSKSNPPAYRIGDMVGYEITGQTPRGASKLKITRNPQPGAGTVTSPPPMDTSNPDLEAATQVLSPRQGFPRPTQQEARTMAQNAPQTQTRLMEYSQLYALCLQNARHTVNDASFDDSAESIRTIASCFFIQALREGLKP